MKEEQEIVSNENSEGKSLGFWSTLSIGIGGMVGGGIFAVLGLAVNFARGGTSVAFALAGLVALVTSYSYAKLSIHYPSQGGTVEFFNQAFGPGYVTGGLNVLLWLSYVIMLALYAFAFGSYGSTFFHPAHRELMRHLITSAIVIILTVLNISGARAVGELEELIVGLKIIILIAFIVFGSRSVEVKRLAINHWAGPFQMIAGGMIIFLAYEGFELIANTASEVRNPGKTLTRAYYASVSFVIVLYVLIAVITVGNLGIDQIVSAKDYALAAAAKPFLGSFGFRLISVAALLSTASAINATLYGASRISYIIAKDGELPEMLEKNIWNRPIEGLLITTGLTLLVSNLLDLSSISTIGSAGFLIIFAAVNAANLILRKKTASNLLLPLLGSALCTLALGLLIWKTTRDTPEKLLILVCIVVLSFVIEVLYRGLTGRRIRSCWSKKIR
jgi:amino acid transporter